MTFKPAKLAFTSMAVILLAGCATGPTPYQAATSDSSTGFSETRIENDRYRVSFTAKSREEAYDLALLRAAELTQSQNYSHFQVVSGGQDGAAARGTNGPRVGVGLGTGRGGYYGRSSGASVGIGIPLGGSREKVRQTLEIKLRRAGGEGADIYNAEDIIRNLGRY